MKSVVWLVVGGLLCTGVRALADEEVALGDELPLFDISAEPYRTPRSGDGFRFQFLGETHDVPSRDRRSLAAWDLGVAVGSPGVDEGEILPFATLYFWERPDEDLLFRGVVVGLYNEILFAYSPPELGPFEVVARLNNLNIPAEQAEVIDGTRFDAEELTWGWIRPGIGGGYREDIAPGEQDNMFSITGIFEPGFYYFDEGEDAGNTFLAPQDTMDLRGHLQVRVDALERNLLELPHEGWLFGADAVYGYRTNWERWGTASAENFREERDYSHLTGYAGAATGVPGVDSERHRLVTVLNGGVGADLDRFSAVRVGGGPHAVGEEFDSAFRPVLPGAAVDEFYPNYYAVFVGEYRWEPIFFTYVSLRGAVGVLDRDRRRSGRMRRDDDVFSAIGARVTTGFLWDTRLQLDYNYNFGVVRRDGYGAHEIVLHISGAFD